MAPGNPRAPWLLALAFLLAACGGRAASAPPAAPTPAASVRPARDPSAALAGHWVFAAQLSGESYAGTMDLTRGADGAWQAKMVENTMGELAVTGVKVAGTTLTVDVDAQGSPATVTGTLQADGTLAGRVLANGDEGTFSARKG